MLGITVTTFPLQPGILFPQIMCFCNLGTFYSFSLCYCLKLPWYTVLIYISLMFKSIATVFGGVMEYIISEYFVGKEIASMWILIWLCVLRLSRPQ